MKPGLTAGWSEAPLDSLLIALETGSRPRGGVKGILTGVPSIGGEHLNADGGFAFEKLRYVPEEFAAKQEKGWIRPNDILVVKDGATTGKCSFVSSAFPHNRALLNEHVFRCAVSPDAVPKYVFYWMWSSSGQEQILQDFRGAAQGGISRNFPRVVKVPLAPFEEQGGIVAALDSFFSRLDEVEAGLERVQRNLKRYRASVLQAAVTGRLVPTEAELARAEGRDYEPASELLKRILVERRKKWEESGRRGKYLEPASPDTSNLPELPEGWCWATVSSLSTKVVDGVHKKPTYQEAGVPFATVRNLTAGPGLNLERLNYVSEVDHREFSRRADPEYGDLLISKDGTLGVVRAVRTHMAFSIFVSVALVKPVERRMSDYLELALSSPIVQAQMVPKGSGLQHIHLEDLREDCVPVPPSSEQRRIANEANRLLSIADDQTAALSHSLIHTARLRQSILKSAFEGKLVNQGASGPPADPLLREIRTDSVAKDSEELKPAGRGRRSR